MSALANTLGVFALILILARLRVPGTGKRVPLAAAILIGGVAIGLLFRLGPGQIAGAAFAGLIAPKTIILAVVVALLLNLSGLMQIGGTIDEIVSLTRSLLRRPAVAMAALPALIGLLPMPGGALFSAPMVRSAAGDAEVDGGLMSAVNYWFRHIWEHWWPLYPGVLLALTYTKGGYVSFAAAQLPLGIFMAATGLLLYRGSHSDLHVAADPPPPGTKRKLLLATRSIWIIVLVWVPVYFILDRIDMSGLSEDLRDAICKYGPVIAGLAASFAFIVATNRPTGEQLRSVFASPSTYMLTGLIVSIMIFQAMLAEVGAAVKIAAELKDMHVPPELVVAILPFIAGLVTGVAVGFVGVSFPIVMAVVASLAAGESILPYVVLAYGFGHLGMMISPLHACHIVSNRYFQTGFGATYRRLLPTAAAMAVLIVAYFFGLRAVL